MNVMCGEEGTQGGIAMPIQIGENKRIREEAESQMAVCVKLSEQ
jgi:hypothetical protein